MASSSPPSAANDDEEEDSVASPNTDDFTVKPVSRIRGDTPSSKPSVAETEEENGNGYEEDQGSRSVKSKRALEFGNGDEESAPPAKKVAVQRIWGLDDEVVVLEGMVEFEETSGTDPYQHMLKFYEFIKDRLQIQVSKKQLMSKIRKMKSKFLSKDDDWVSSRPLEKPAFEVSKKIWGEEKLKANPTGGGGNKKKDDETKGVKTNGGSTSRKRKLNGEVILALPVPEESERKQGGTANKQKVDDHHKSKGAKPKIVRKSEAVSKPSLCWMDSVIEFSTKLGNGDGSLIRDGMKLVANSQLKALNEKWNKIEVEAAELHLKRLRLIHESTRLVLDALHS